MLNEPYSRVALSLDKGNVEKLIGSVELTDVDRYSEYWQAIRPVTLMDRYHRWLFSYCSVRATWKMNKDTFHLLSSEPWYSEEELRALLEKARIGMYDVRTKGIWHLRKTANTNSILLSGMLGDWQEWRNYLVDNMFGLGLAKISFALEMCHPLTCRVVCLDTHLLQMYGIKAGKVTPRIYAEMENHWIGECDKRDLPSPMVRHILWDRIQDKTDTRYWSYVLEDSSNWIPPAHQSALVSLGEVNG